MTPYEELEDETWAYLQAVVRGKRAKTIKNKEKSLIEAYTEAIKETYKVKTYKQDEILKPAIIDYLKITKQMLNDEYSKIVDMEEIAEKSYDAMEAYLMAKEKAGEKRNAEYDKLTEAQNQFAELHNVNLIDGTMNERQLKIQQAGKCLSYDNQLFLLFFKAYHQEGYVFEAIKAKDLNGLEQSLSTLNQFANEGLEKLKDIKSYNGDASLKDGAKEILSYFKQESEKDLIPATDFLLIEQDFNKLKAKFEAKGPKNRSQDDIDKFNKKVNELNSAAELFNKAMDKANKSRATEINQFYKTREQFISKNG